ncbi:SagG family ABC transporter permease subunit [Streptococcus equi subsp. zooepidemicus]|uniref:SagG family ABC transporter permease subunit n=1 Tax=Streptococcus equi TaxID=1336 RepID=UPI001E2A7B25|nr:SagG family ABC transporter permease subunit [Streptococcus equi]MCD3370527.1 SagG family ABC transporter permease subunit [Streptococcus equi subsp. zooepidemicus]MCD3379697.1 SagG family ABC transporter permease subunit [Streptococcus equi subsp. zooepidemicus]HEL0564991.1 ABC transporter permease [Streptococcus equi subsp. zooepidemicus]HEL0781860.1 ABC transporter permease [Streptococcus equi subsp. zooepidemicus]HEL0803487.1 ABC transporter permease [Streptococcus equi subsp. zooepidem
MVLFHLIKKESLQIFRDRTALLMMVVFPILMILILSFAFKSSFNTAATVPKLTVRYQLEGKETEYQKNFITFLKLLNKELHLEAKETKDIAKAKQKVSEGALTAALEVKSDQNIEVTTNSINQQNADLINMLVNIYVDNAKTYDSIASLYPEAISNIKKRKIDYIASSSVQTSKGMSSADYYAISMFTMITFYSIMSAMNLVLSDRQQGVASRIYLTGVSNSAILLGKLIGGMLATAVQLTLLYVFTRFVLRVNWGPNDWQIIGVTASLVYLSVAIGIGLATGIRNQSFLTVASNAVIPIFAFLGGSYIPLSTLNSALINQLSNISPIKWVNDSLFYLIFGGQSNPIPVTLMVNLGIGTAFILFALVRMRKQVAA